MRFFLLVCLFGLAVGVIGCASGRWPSQNWFGQPAEKTDLEGESEPTKTSPWSRGGKAAGIDPTAREIEQNLGYQ
jgi:hypothetical protein